MSNIRDDLISLAEEARRFELRTRHLRFSQGEKVESLTLQLANEKLHDPLRELLVNRS